jgi:predicted acetyltransferase
MHRNLKTLLAELLQNSEENGYPVWSLTPKVIADDIIEKTGFSFDEEYDVVIETIQTILNEHNTKGMWRK